MSLITESEPSQESKINIISISIILIGIITLIFSLFIYTLTKAPSTLSEQTAIEVTQGMSVRSIATKAKQEGVVRSELLLYVILTSFYDPTNIHAGTYVFTEPASVFKVAEKIASSDVNETLITITIPEGIPLTKIADIVTEKLAEFDADEYLLHTEELEGYLFPETYFVPKKFTAADLIVLQRATYEENILPLRTLIASSTFSEYEMLILASIVEREANDEESMKMVSGILQNRLQIGMALQADASIEYELDKPLSELTAADLELESPYNTYLNPGLTPTPIGNPGLQSIKAVLEPTESNYFYYITDENGTFHYAKTFEEHKLNVQKYLR